MKYQSLLISVAALGALLAFQGCAQMGGGGALTCKWLFAQ